MKKPAGSLKARRTSIGPPPVSGIAVTPSAYESATRKKMPPTPSSTHGRSPPAKKATIPSAMKSDEPISP